MNYYGVPNGQEDNISSHLKAIIKTQDTTVTAYLGQGSSKSITANWNQPFLDAATGGMFSIPAAVLQTYTGYSINTQGATTVVWGGNEPIEITLELNFKAFDDPQNEVNGAIEALEKFASPMYSKSVGGTIPAIVQLKIGKLIFNHVVISSVSSPIDMNLNTDGYFMRGTVSLSIKSLLALSQGDISNGVYGAAKK